MSENIINNSTPDSTNMPESKTCECVGNPNIEMFIISICGKGTGLMIEGKWREALDCFMQIVAKNIICPSLFYYCGKCLLNLNQNKEAAKYIEMSIISEKEDEELLQNLAESCFRSGNYGKAIFVWGHLSQLDPDDSLYYYNIARAFFCMKDSENALDYLNQAIELDPACTDAVVLKDKILKTKQS